MRRSSCAAASRSLPGFSDISGASRPGQHSPPQYIGQPRVRQTDFLGVQCGLDGRLETSASKRSTEMGLRRYASYSCQRCSVGGSSDESRMTGKPDRRPIMEQTAKPETVDAWHLPVGDDDVGQFARRRPLKRDSEWARPGKVWSRRMAAALRLRALRASARRSHCTCL
jgi:hypothetical protein